MRRWRIASWRRGCDRGPLHGVPIAVKDLIDIAGVPTTAASRVREGHTAAADAPVITHLRHAGAVLIGKTNLDEFAFGTTSEHSAFGGVRHPLDPTRSPGGSSGGSAVAVATGMALAALGTDTGGSIRIPAAACGIVGLKPAYGEVSTDGVVPLCVHLRSSRAVRAHRCRCVARVPRSGGPDSSRLSGLPLVITSAAWNSPRIPVRSAGR